MNYLCTLLHQSASVILVLRISAHSLVQFKVHRPWALFRESMAILQKKVVMMNYFMCTFCLFKILLLCYGTCCHLHSAHRISTLCMRFSFCSTRIFLPLRPGNNVMTYNYPHACARDKVIGHVVVVIVVVSTKIALSRDLGI